MKSGGGGLGAAVPSYGVPAKRRWRGFVIAVLGLVILSMLVPLVFLLGLHNGFHSSGNTRSRSRAQSLRSVTFSLSHSSLATDPTLITPLISLSTAPHALDPVAYQIELVMCDAFLSLSEVKLNLLF